MQLCGGEPESFLRRGRDYLLGLHRTRPDADVVPLDEVAGRGNTACRCRLPVGAAKANER